MPLYQIYIGRVYKTDAMISFLSKPISPCLLFASSMTLILAIAQFCSRHQRTRSAQYAILRWG
jgi:hypothetical protein